MELLYRFFISGTYQISSWEIFFSNSVHFSSHLLMTLDCAEILNFIEIYLQFFRLFSKLFVLFRNLLTAHLPQVFSSSGFSSDFKVSDLKWRSMVNLIWIMFYKLIYGDFASLFYMEISNIDLLKTVSNLLPVFDTFIKNRLFVTTCIYL